jgi:hypothetical protein
MTVSTMTIREIRKVLFDTEYDVTINSIEFTNQQARSFFFIFDNQDKLLKTVAFEITNKFSIWIVD